MKRVATRRCASAGKSRCRDDSQADGQLLTGKEISVTLLESGITVQRYWDWTPTPE